LCPSGTARRSNQPRATFLLDGLHRALSVDAGTGSDGGVGKTACIAKRVEAATTTVNEARRVPFGSEQVGRLDAIEHLDRSAQRCPTVTSPLQMIMCRSAVGTLDPTRACGRTLNLMALDQIKDEVGKRAGGGKQTSAFFLAIA